MRVHEARVRNLDITQGETLELVTDLQWVEQHNPAIDRGISYSKILYVHGVCWAFEAEETSVTRLVPDVRPGDQQPLNTHWSVVLPDVKYSSFEQSLTIGVTHSLDGHLVELEVVLHWCYLWLIVHAIEDIAVHILVDPEGRVLHLDPVDVLESEEIQVDVASEGKILDCQGHLLVQLDKRTRRVLHSWERVHHQFVVDLAVDHWEINLLADGYQAVAVIKLIVDLVDKILWEVSIRHWELHVENDVLKDQAHTVLRHGAFDLEPQVGSGDLDPCVLWQITGLDCQDLDGIVDKVLLDHEEGVVPVRVQDDFWDRVVHLHDSLNVFEVVTDLAVVFKYYERLTHLTLR